MITAIIEKQTNTKTPGKLCNAALKAISNFEFFCSNFINLLNPNGIYPFILNDSQKIMNAKFDKLESGIVSLMSSDRQKGKTTFLLAKSLYEALFFNKKVIVITHSENQKRFHMKKVLFWISKNTDLSQLVEFVNGVKSSKRNEIAFFNGGSIKFCSSSEPMAGLQADLVLMDEFNFFNENDSDPARYLLTGAKVFGVSSDC